MSRRTWGSIVMMVAALGVVGRAQGGRPASPAGVASAEVRGMYAARPNGELAYRGGKWMEVVYSRPIKRGRDLWGAGADYGKKLSDGAPVWRAGANVSTELKTEVPLVINGKTVVPGVYTIFIDLKPTAWTLIVSTFKASKDYPSRDKDALWGAFDYSPARDVVRASMKLETLPHSVEQLTWKFLDMTDAGGTLAIVWDTVMASVPFTIGS